MSNDELNGLGTEKKKGLAVVDEESVSSDKHGHSHSSHSHHSHSGEKKRKSLAFVEEETAERQTDISKPGVDPRLIAIAAALLFVLFVGVFAAKRIGRVVENYKSMTTAATTTVTIGTSDDDAEHHFGKRYTETRNENYSATYNYEDVDIDSTSEKKDKKDKDKDKTEKEKKTETTVDENGNVVTVEATDVDPKNTTEPVTDYSVTRTPHTLRPSNSKVLNERTWMYYDDSVTKTNKSKSKDDKEASGSVLEAKGIVIIDIIKDGKSQEKIYTNFEKGYEFTEDDALEAAKSKDFDVTDAKVSDNVPFTVVGGKIYSIKVECQ